MKAGFFVAVVGRS